MSETASAAAPPPRGGPPRAHSAPPGRAVARRLGELACDERHLQVDFLLHLAEFDRRRAYLELGYGSLWTYLLEALHLREGAAGRRIGAMKVLRRFPRLADALRDGRLCLTTLSQLGPVLAEENADDLIARAAYRTAAEVDHLVASMKPRPAPREGIRRLPEPATAEPPGTDGEASPAARASGSPARPEAAASARLVLEGEADGEREPLPHPAEAAPLAAVDEPCPRTAEVRAVSERQWSLRVTIDRACKEDLEALSMLLSHKLPKGDLAAVLHEAVRCGLEKHGKRKGAVRPGRQVEPKANHPKDPAAIPAAVRRQVWERDGGRCTWTGPDGRRCDSRWQLEVDHVDPAARSRGPRGRGATDEAHLTG